MEQIDQMRAASELLAQRVMERVLDVVVASLDVNELAQQVDVNGLLSRLDLNAVMAQIDLNALLDRVDVQALAERIDIEALIQHGDLGAVIATSSGHVTGQMVDLLRGQAVALDRWIDRWACRLLHRGNPGLSAPLKTEAPALLKAEAGT
ncbi:MAG: hypothetical protein ACRDN0_32485 [Trebonia sp.]